MPRQKISGRMQSHNRARFALRTFLCHACLPSPPTLKLRRGLLLGLAVVRRTKADLPGAAIEEPEQRAPKLEKWPDSFG